MPNFKTGIFFLLFHFGMQP